MQTRMILSLLAIFLASYSLPVKALAAQRGGFVSAINPGFVGPAAGLGVGPAVAPAYPSGVGRHYPGSSLTNYSRPHSPPRATPARPANPLPPGVSVTTPRHPRSSYVRPGSFISTSPPHGTRVAPGYETPGTGDTAVRTGKPVVPPRHGGPHRPGHPFPVLVPAYPVFSVGPLHGHPPAHYPITLGMPRADVILFLGDPRVTIARPGSETLIFSDHTVVLEDGIVAVIR